MKKLKVFLLIVIFSFGFKVFADDIVPPLDPTLSSITITTPENKLTYSVGDTLDITGLVVTGTYSDASTKVETITATNITGFDSSAPATNQVLTITDGTQTTTYTVNVNAIVTHLNISADVDVPTSCSATDNDGVVHNYSEDGTYFAICALETAIANGAISSVKLSNQYPSMGLFITQINNVTADPNSQYWTILQNGNSAQLGIVMLPVNTGDSIVIQLHDFSDNNIGDQVTLNIHSLIAPVSGSGGGSGGGNPPPIFSVPNAISYLNGVQGSDGSFGGADLYTDWVAIAYSSNNSSNSNILNYMTTHNTVSGNLTDNERHSMALLALNQNPYSFHGADFISPIVKAFDGTQFGGASLINDDIFSLIPLSSAGYNSNDDIISKDISYIISKQNSDGSWDESVDMTGAGIMALSQFSNVSGVSIALSKAGNYIYSQQANDGGWGNVSSTSWALQAQSALSVNWSKNGKTGLDYLASQQTSDGGALPANEIISNRIWATSYAIPGALGKTWAQIMHSVSKPIEQNITGGGGGGGEIINSTNINSGTNIITTPPVDQIIVKDVITPNMNQILPIVTPIKTVVEAKKKITAPLGRTVLASKNEEKPIEESIPKSTQIATVTKTGAKIPVAVSVFTVALVGGVLGFRYRRK